MPPLHKVSSHQRQKISLSSTKKKTTTQVQGSKNKVYIAEVAQVSFSLIYSDIQVSVHSLDSWSRAVKEVLSEETIKWTNGRLRSLSHICV